MSLVTAHLQFHGTATADVQFPANLQNCVMKVLQGEYAFTAPPDMPKIRRILDVGGNVGAFAIWAHLQWGDAWIDSYEPNPQAAELAQRNVPPGVKVHNVAVTTEENPKLYVGGDWGWSSTIPGLNPYGEEAFDVKALHPRELPSCDLLKLDCEGCELEIVEEYRHWSGVKVCMFEWHNEGDRHAIEHVLIREGLRCFKSTMDRVNLGQEVWIRSACRWDERTGRYVV